mmetsp:Transcript_1026/g.2735  ORF Transcript_1026/g.2735 Transcript_1026/m.2735 type:complete len:208 (-) Transcript_1026:678-1301(-)
MPASNSLATNLAATLPSRLCCRRRRAPSSISHDSLVTQLLSALMIPPAVLMFPPLLCAFSFATAAASPTLASNAYPVTPSRSITSRRHDASQRGVGGFTSPRNDLRDRPLRALRPLRLESAGETPRGDLLPRPHSARRGETRRGVPRPPPSTERSESVSSSPAPLYRESTPPGEFPSPYQSPYLSQSSMSSSWSHLERVKSPYVACE